MSQAQQELYERAIRDVGALLDRLPRGYEADPEKRRDLCQEIHFQIWRSLAAFDGRCALSTWVFRVAHNAATSYVTRERRGRQPWVSLEEVELATSANLDADLDRGRQIDELSALIRELKPLDRQIILGYLEDLDAREIAEITGLSPAAVAMKIHRIKRLLEKWHAKGDARHGG